MRKIAFLLLVSLFMFAGCGSDSSSGSDVSGDPDVVSQNDTSLDGRTPDQQSDSDVITDVEDNSTQPDEIDPPDGVTPDGDEPDAIEDLDGQEIPDVPPTDIPEDGEVEEDVPPVDELIIQISEPTDGETVSGSIRVKIIPVGIDELKVDSVSVGVNGMFAYGDTKLPTEFVYDTTYDDEATVTITANAHLGNLHGTDEVELVKDNPGFKIKRAYAQSSSCGNGDELFLYVSTGVSGMDITTDFSALDSGYVEGDEAVYETLQGEYLISYTVTEDNEMPDGEYAIPITVSKNGYSHSTSQVTVTLVNQLLLPLRVEGGIFVPSSLPDPSESWTQPISLVYGNDFIITGGSAKATVDFGGYAYPEQIVGILVGLQGYHGYYQVPVDNSSGEEEILMLLRVYVDPEEPPSALPIQIAVRDVKGNISEFVTHELSVQSVGSGDVQVSVSWDTETDLDLHVITPNNCEMYYGHKQCGAGWLDLDSNPACSIDGINNENVYFPEGQAPVGTYTVRVDFWEDCYGSGANYTVTLHYCGDVEVVEGHFDPYTDDSGGAGSGVTVAEFSNVNCGRILRGRVRYEDRTYDKEGFGATTWRPVRYAQVEVNRVSDGQLLSTGYTDRSGNYEIQFDNKEDPGIYIVVKSITNFEEGLRLIKVMNHPKFNVVYSVSSASIDETESEFPILDFDIPSVVGAGAFNILDVVSDGYDLIRLMTGKDLGELNVYWATGADTTDTLYCSDFFYEQGSCSEQDALSVQGKEIDRDEYDDMVILKEFFKFAVDQVSNDDNPGGDHNGTRDDPRRSWAEGASTFFACSTAGYRHFVNGMPMGVYEVFDLEVMDSPFAYKTQTGTQNGLVSEFLIAAMLWDLADTQVDDEPFDNVHGMQLAIYDSIFNYFAAQTFTDRGFEGVDFVDFLDGWFCRGWEEEAGVSQLLDSREFDYDFNGPENCAF